jgi:hypothetical protein
MSVWVVAEAAQLVLASDLMLAASAGTVVGGHAVGSVAHRKAAHPGLPWRNAVVASAHDRRPLVPVLAVRAHARQQDRHESAVATATRVTAVVAGALLGLAGVMLAAASGHLPATWAVLTGAVVFSVIAGSVAALAARRSTVRAVLSRRGLHLMAGAAFRELAISVSMTAPVLVVAHTAGVPDVSLLEVVAVVLATRLVVAAVPVGSGVGVADVTLVAGLAWMGVAIPVGIAAVLVWRACTIAIAIALAAIGHRTSPVALPSDAPSSDGIGRRLHRAAFASLGWLPAAIRDRVRGRVFDAMFSLSPDPWGYAAIPYERRKQERLLEAVGDSAGVIVEVGCADGHNLLALAERHPNATIIGTDVSQTAVRIAAERTADCAGIRVVHAADLEGLRRALPGPVDCLVLAEVLYYLGSQQAIATALQPLRQYLHPDGRVVMVHGAADAEVLHGRAASALGMRVEDLVEVVDHERPFHVAVAVVPRAQDQES